MLLNEPSKGVGNNLWLLDRGDMLAFDRFEMCIRCQGCGGGLAFDGIHRIVFASDDKDRLGEFPHAILQRSASQNDRSDR